MKIHLINIKIIYIYIYKILQNYISMKTHLINIKITYIYIYILISFKLTIYHINYINILILKFYLNNFFDKTLNKYLQLNS